MIAHADDWLIAVAVTPPPALAIIVALVVALIGLALGMAIRPALGLATRTPLGPRLRLGLW